MNGTEPRDSSQFSDIVMLVMQTAGDYGKAGTSALLTDPTGQFQAAGLPIQEFDRFKFREFFYECIEENEDLISWLRDPTQGDFFNIPNIKCTACKIGAWSVAALIAAIGTTAIGYLSVASGAVLALSAFASVTTTVALGFIQALGAEAIGGIKLIADKICKWSKACR